MLTDEQLVERLRFELSPLRPRHDLAVRVREQARARSRPLRSIRSLVRPGRFGPRIVGPLVLAAGAIVVLAVALPILLVSHNAEPVPSTYPAPGGTRVPTSNLGQSGTAQSPQDKRLREKDLRELSHYPTYHADRSLLAGFFVFSVNSRSGVRIPSGLTISKPRLSSLPLGALDMITREYPKTFMRGCHPKRVCEQLLHGRPFIQPDLSQIRQVTSPKGLAFWVVPGRQGLCFIAGEQDGTSGSCVNLKAAEKSGEGESAGRTSTTGTYYFLLPKAHPTAKILAGPHRWRTIRPLDGVYIGPGYPEG